jgi:hypothetical protein
LCLKLYDDLGSPESNALWLVPLLYTLGDIAENPDTPAETKAVLHEHLVAYYEQQRLYHPAGEFVSPSCMWAMGKALAASGNDETTATLGDGLRSGAADWFRRLGYEDEALRLEERSETGDRPVLDLVGELLSAYGQLLNDGRELPRVETARIQKCLRAMVRRGDLKARRHWELWGRAVVRLGKRADPETRRFIRQRIKDTEDPNEKRILELISRRLPQE